MKFITTISVIAITLLVAACGNADLAELAEASCKAQNGDIASIAVLSAIGEKHKGDVEFAKKATEIIQKPCK